jgi:formylglycine-generating enzyme required for sulfatase activity
VEFCARLSKLTGETYRLPTEAEWEYAARAGSTEIYPGNLDDMGWYEKNSGGKTHPVGEKKPNAWGLYDMQGNVWEWCMDWYGDYSTKPEIDPKGAALGNARVFRGGCWYGPAVFCRPALRFYFPPSDGNNDLGFRLVKEIK